MPIRISGLTSGLDTESIVGALVSAYSFKKEKYVKAQTKLSWKQDAWKELNSKVYSLYTSIGNMRYESSYATKKASVSDSTKAKASASGNAILGTQTLQVKQLAKTAYITGGQLASDVDADTSLSQLGIKTGNEKASIQVRTNSGGTTKIELESTMTVNQLISKLNDAGVQASFDSKNHRIFVSGKQSGQAGEFSIMANNALGLNALGKLGLLTDSELNAISNSNTDTSELVKKQFGSGVGTASDFTGWLEKVKEYKDIINSDTAIQEEKEAAEYEINYEPTYRYIAEYFDGKSGFSWSDITEDNISEYGKELYDKGTLSESAVEATKSELIKSINNVRDKYVLLAKANAMPEETAAEKAAKETAVAKAKADVDTVLTDPTNKKWADYIEKNFGSKDGEGDYAYTTFWSQSDNLALADSVYYRMDLAQKIEAGELDVSKINTGKKIDGVDAEIVLNGVTYTSATNSVTVNGLTVEALGETKEDEVISLTVSNDTDALYDKIKDFLSQYNSLMNEMQKLYNADSAKDYEPLTDDEKNEMSESEIEKWEQKIKDSLLRRDTSLSGIISTMTLAMMKTYEVNGETWSLSGTLGIHTLGSLNAEKNEGYAYHIDGDSEDSKTSGKQDKLRAALNDDPSSVVDFLRQLTTGLYNDLDAKMKSTSVKSVYTVYNDKEMASEYSSYSRLIKTWADRVTDMEDAYYKKFSKMESALAKLQNNSSSITSMLGG